MSAVCGCRVDSELGAGPGCTGCGHRDHGSSGCRAVLESAPATEDEVDDMHPDAVYARQWEPTVRGGLDRVAWLIERGQVTGYPATEWFGGEGWTTDAWSALWFADRRSAQQFIDQRTTPPGYNPFGVAVEHGFARQSAPATEDEVRVP